MHHGPSYFVWIEDVLLKLCGELSWSLFSATPSRQFAFMYSCSILLESNWWLMDDQHLFIGHDFVAHSCQHCWNVIQHSCLWLVMVVVVCVHNRCWQVVWKLNFEVNSVITWGKRSLECKAFAFEIKNSVSLLLLNPPWSSVFTWAMGFSPPITCFLLSVDMNFNISTFAVLSKSHIKFALYQSTGVVVSLWSFDVNISAFKACPLVNLIAHIFSITK